MEQGWVNSAIKRGFQVCLLWCANFQELGVPAPLHSAGAGGNCFLKLWVSWFQAAFPGLQFTVSSLTKEKRRGHEVTHAHLHSKKKKITHADRERRLSLCCISTGIIKKIKKTCWLMVQLQEMSSVSQLEHPFSSWTVWHLHETFFSFCMTDVRITASKIRMLLTTCGKWSPTASFACERLIQINPPRGKPRSDLEWICKWNRELGSRWESLRCVLGLMKMTTC